MNEYPKRYELKLRSDNSGDHRYSHTNNIRNVNRVDKHKTNEEMPSFRTGFCVILLLFVMFLKAGGGEESADILSKMDNLINSQFDIQKTTQVMAEFASDAADYFSGENKNIELNMPVKEASLYEGFVETVHPVFMTSISPTGVTFAAQPSAYVYSAESGRVNSVIENSDGTKRVVIKYDKNISVAYDNLSNVYVKQDDLVGKEQIIALLKEETPAMLKFEVWVDNVAVDPMQYITETVSAYAQTHQE